MSNGLFLGGLISGMSTNEVIQQILDLEAARIKTQETRKTALAAKQTAWQDMRSSLNTLRSRLDTVRFSTLYQSRKVTMANEAIGSMTAGANSALTTHSLEVRALASTHVVGGARMANPNAELGAPGSLVINDKAISVDSQDTLNSLRDKINATADVGVTAQVVKVVRGTETTHQLVLTSKASGEAGRIRMNSTSGLINTAPGVVDAASTVAAGPFDITVTKLAEPAVVQSDSVDPLATFTGSFQINGVTVNVNGDMNSVAAAIDGAGAGVTATVVGDRLELTSLGAPNNITFGADSDGILQSMGVVTGSLAAKNVVTDPNAIYSVNGTTYTSLENSIVSAGGIAGLNLTLVAPGTARIGDLAQQLGFQSNDGSFSNVISKGDDAHFFLNNVEYKTSSNTVTDILPGVNLTIKGIGTSTASVNQDVDKVADAVQQWVDAINSTLTLIREKSSADPKTREAGPLNADPLTRQLESTLRKYVSNVVAGLPTTMNTPSQIGITTGAWGSVDYGKVVLDKEKLKAKLLEDADGVAKLLGAARQNLAPTATITASHTDAGTFDAAWVANGDSDAARFGSVGGGWQSSEVGSSLTFSWGGAVKSIDQVLLSIPDVNGTTGLKAFTLKYEDANGVWHDLSTVTNHTGSSKLFTFDTVSAKSVRLEISATYGDSPARISELTINETNNGAAIDMFRFVSSALNTTNGPLANRDETLTKQMRSLTDTISKLNDNMTKHELQLRQQFARMESALQKLRMQGDAFTSQIMGLMGAQSQKR